MGIYKFPAFRGTPSTGRAYGEASGQEQEDEPQRGNPVDAQDQGESYGDAVHEVPGPGAQRKSRSRKRLSPAAVIARSLAPDATHLSPADIIARSVENAFGGFPSPFERPLTAPAPTRRPAPPNHPMFAPSPFPPQIDPFNDFWNVWMEHQDYLLKQGLRFMSGNMADAEDALSQAMLKGSQHFDGNEIRNERAWLTRLVHNACMDQHRSRKRQQRLSDEVIPDDPQDSPTLQPQPHRTPDEALHMNQVFAELEDQLKQLPISLLEPLMLRVIEDKSYDEIAALLGLSNCAVRKRIQLARDRLKQAGVA
jgi:RNA polymerase sigma-70 factor (ECF subfamily)